MYIIKNAVLLLLIMPLTSVLVAILYFAVYDSGGEYAFTLLLLLPFSCVVDNLYGITFSMIFLRKIKLVLASAVAFIANMFLSLLWLAPLTENFHVEYSVIMVGTNVISFLLSLGIVIFDRIFMKRYFKKLSTMDNDIIFDRINKMKISNVVFYLDKYRQKEQILYNSLVARLKEPTLYSNIIANFGEIKTKRLFEANTKEQSAFFFGITYKGQVMIKKSILLITILGVLTLSLFWFGLIF